MHVRHRTRADVFRVLHAVGHEPHRRRLQLAQRLLERGGDHRRRLAPLGRRGLLADDLEQCLHRTAALQRQLAADQIHRLHAVGAFVDHRDPGIADILFHAPFGDIAVAAIDLLRVGRDFIALVGADALDHRGEQADQVARHLALLLGAGMMLQVDLQRAPQAQRAQPLGPRLGLHQHAADVGMDEQRVRLLVRLLGAGERAALTAILGILYGVLIGDLGDAEPLQADAEPRRIHHDEHGRKALHLLADQPALGAVIVHHAGRIGVDAHLVLDRAAGDRVALAEAAVVVDQHLGHHEQRNALRTVGRARRLGQHEMNDIVGEVVLAGRDEDLGAGDRIGAVRLRLRLGADQAEVGAALRLGEVHRAAPFARHHLGDVHLLLLGAALGDQRGDRAMGKAGVHGEGHVRRDHIFLEGDRDDVRHALPAIFGRIAERRPAALDILVVRLLEAGRRGDAAVLVAGAAFEIARLVEREQHFGDEAAALLQHRLDHVGGGGVEAGQVRIILQADDVFEDEARVADGGRILGHPDYPCVSAIWTASTTATNSVSSAMAASMSCFWRSSSSIRARQRSIDTCRWRRRPSSRS